VNLYVGQVLPVPSLFAGSGESSEAEWKREGTCVCVYVCLIRYIVLVFQ